MRQFVALVAMVAVAGVASADGLAPPPKGKRFVSVSYEALTGKDVKGYVFVTATTTGGRPGSQQTFYGKVELSEKKAVTLASPTDQVRPNAQYGSTALIAVPEDAAKEFKTDKELFDALNDMKVKGVQSIRLMRQMAVDEKVKEKTLTWTYTITGIDDKGIQTTVSGEGYEEPKKPEEKKPLAFAEPGTVFGGLMGAAAVTLGGLWLIRRRKA